MKYLIALLLLIALPVSANLKGTMDKNGQQLSITIYYANNKQQLDQKVLDVKRKVLHPNQSGIAFYAYADNICEVFLIRPKKDSAYELAKLGDEIYHCTNGDYHK